MEEKKASVKLTEFQKVWLVQRFAVFFGTPTEIGAEFEKEFGRPIARQHVHQYNPDNPAMTDRLSQRLKNVFAITREKFLNDTTAIPIANKAYRLNELNDLFRDAKKKNLRGMAKEILEQAAKEAGDAYTNRRELTGAGGGAISIETKEATVDLSKLSVAERAQLLELSEKVYGTDPASA